MAALKGEFSLIKQYFEQLTPARDDVLLGIGDDCALLQCPADHVMAVSIDTLVEDVHFFSDVDPVSLGYKSLAVGLSDLAAMGATPTWFTLALTLPEFDEAWLQGFSQGLASLASKHNIQLVGGDTTRGSLTISIQVHGTVKPEIAMKRNGAQLGDMIYVTGTLGDAGAALQYQLQQWQDGSLTQDDYHYLKQRLELPSPRVSLGEELSSFASSTIDISDGLLADLGHILEESSVNKQEQSLGARLDLTQLPLSSTLNKINPKVAQTFALQSGDDYELCFTASPKHFAELEQQFQGQITRIGMITDDDGLYYIDNDDQLIELKREGYDHFNKTNIS